MSSAVRAAFTAEPRATVPLTRPMPVPDDLAQILAAS
jgi:hypothetical protein